MQIAFVLGNRRETIDRTEIGADNFREVPIIQQRLKTAFSRQKNYADSKKKDVLFSVGDLVFLKVFQGTLDRSRFDHELEK